MRCTFIVFTARVRCSVVCSIVSLANSVRRYKRCRSALLVKAGYPNPPLQWLKRALQKDPLNGISAGAIASKGED